jgi:hypothetical protein
MDIRAVRRIGEYAAERELPYVLGERSLGPPDSTAEQVLGQRGTPPRGPSHTVRPERSIRDRTFEGPVPRR